MRNRDVIYLFQRVSCTNPVICIMSLSSSFTNGTGTTSSAHISTDDDIAAARQRFAEASLEASKHNTADSLPANVTVVRIPSHAAFTDGKIQLSPYDLSCLGRTVPMVWFYRETLNTEKLLSSFAMILMSHPVLSGRYDGTTPPTWIALNNAGVPIEIVEDEKSTIDQAISHLPSATSSEATATMFPVQLHAKYVPEKKGMDPDTSSPHVPLLKIKITTFQGRPGQEQGGTAIGILCQHGVLDGESMITMMRNWSNIYRGEGLDPIPNHDRMTALEPEAVTTAPIDSTINSTNDSTISTEATFVVVPKGEKFIPPFAQQMPKIMGDPKQCVACCVPFPKMMCASWKEESKKVLPEGKFCSTDDLLTARTWQALTKVRCNQVGVALDDENITTTLSRAYNFRKRTDPPLGPSYCGNGTTGVRTTMAVKELLSMTPSELAHRLRQDIIATPVEMISVRAKWLKGQYDKGCTVAPVTDQQALTFIISSWNFDWEGVNFNATPICYDMGAIVPIVAVIVPRKGGDGFQVYVSGPGSDMEKFAAIV